MKKFFKLQYIIFYIICIISIIYLAKPDNQNLSGNKNTLMESKPITTFPANINPIINSEFDNNFFLTTGSQTRFLDFKGIEKWNYANNFNNPSVSFSGGYLSVRENSAGKLVNVFNSKGFLYSAKLDDKSSKSFIIDANVNANGYLAVLSSTSDGYSVNVYNESGFNVMTLVMETLNLYPISVDISPDSKVVAVDSIDTTGLKVGSNITLSYVNQSDSKSQTSTINSTYTFSGLPLKDEVVGKIKFVGDNLIAYSDLGIKILNGKNLSQTKTVSITFNNNIDHVQIIDNKYIAVALGAKTNTSDYSIGTVLIYDLKGNIVGKNLKGDKVLKFLPAQNGVMIVEEKNCYELTTNGKILWNYTPTKDIQSLNYIGNSSLGILVGNNDIVSIFN